MLSKILYKQQASMNFRRGLLRAQTFSRCFSTEIANVGEETTQVGQAAHKMESPVSGKLMTNQYAGREH